MPATKPYPLRATQKKSLNESEKYKFVSFKNRKFNFINLNSKTDITNDLKLKKKNCCKFKFAMIMPQR